MNQYIDVKAFETDGVSYWRLRNTGVHEGQELAHILTGDYVEITARVVMASYVFLGSVAPV